MNNRAFAKVTGWSLIIMAIAAAFSIGYALPLFNSADPELLKSTLSAQVQLYKYMLAGIVLILLLDIVTSWTLYGFFKYIRKTWSFGAMALRLAYTVIFAVASYQLAKNLGAAESDALAINYQAFDTIWSFGLIVFGFHLLFIGLLMRAHGRIHVILWVLTLIASISYVLVHLLKTTVPQLNDFTSNLEMVLSLPMALGELGLAVWMIVRGGKGKTH